jgi:hypothetical protein
MNLFVSYAFNEDNRWIEDLAMPLIRALGFEVITGRRIEGEIIVESVEARMRTCRGCIAFTTRRDPLENGKFGTHQWVLDELATARALGLTVVEVREDVVEVQGAANAFAQLRFARDARDKLLVQLAETLTAWPTRLVRVRIQPPQAGANEFLRFVLRGGVKCKYQLQDRGRIIADGEAVIEPITAGFFVDLEIPRADVLVQIEIKKDSANGWKSLGSSVLAVPIEVYDY